MRRCLARNAGIACVARARSVYCPYRRFLHYTHPAIAVPNVYRSYFFTISYAFRANFMKTPRCCRWFFFFSNARQFDSFEIFALNYAYRNYPRGTRALQSAILIIIRVQDKSPVGRRDRYVRTLKTPRYIIHLLMHQTYINHANRRKRRAGRTDIPTRNFIRRKVCREKVYLDGIFRFFFFIPLVSRRACCLVGTFVTVVLYNITRTQHGGSRYRVPRLYSA